jgi:hypothetical protein
MGALGVRRTSNTRGVDGNTKAFNARYQLLVKELQEINRKPRATQPKKRE